MRHFNRFFSIAILSTTLAGCAIDGSQDGAPNSVMPAARTMAAGAERQGDWEGAARHWRAALAATPGDRAATVSLARALRLTGNCGQAATVLSEILIKTPNDSDALIESAKCHLVSARLEAAEQQLMAAIEATTDSWEARTTLAVVYDRLGRHIEAQLHHDHAVMLAPDRPLVLSNKALSLALAGSIADALPLMRRAAGHPAATARVRMNLAVLEAMAGNGDRATSIASQEMLDDKPASLTMLRRLAEQSGTPTIR